MANKYTHKGTVTIRNYGPLEKLLRETSKFWIDEDGRKYHKESGSVVGDVMFTCRLDLASIRERVTE